MEDLRSPEQKEADEWKSKGLVALNNLLMAQVFLHLTKDWLIYIYNYIIIYVYVYTH